MTLPEREPGLTPVRAMVSVSTEEEGSASSILDVDLAADGDGEEFKNLPLGGGDDPCAGGRGVNPCMRGGDAASCPNLRGGCRSALSWFNKLE